MTRSDQLRLDLALLVASPSSPASVLNPDNTRSVVVSIEHAVRDRVPFFVEIGSDFLAVDFDWDVGDGDPDGLKQGALLVAAIRLRGYRAVLLPSGGPGRAHVWAWVPNPGHRDDFSQMAEELDGDVRRFIRPPSTPHRQAGQPGIADVSLSVAEMEYVLAELTSCSEVRISDRMWRCLVHGADVDRYASDSEFICAGATALVNAGMTLADYTVVVGASSLAVSEAYARRAEKMGEVRAETWLQRVWVGAERFVAAQPARSDEHAAELAAYEIWTRHQSWPGQKGTSDRDVLLALITRATEVGHLTVGISERDLTTGAGLGSRTTVHRAIDRLRERGLIEEATGEAKRGRPPARKPAPPGRSCTIWTLCLPADLWTVALDSAEPVTADHVSLLVKPDFGTLNADIWFNGTGGLGKGPQRTYETLLMLRGATSQQLSDYTGFMVGTVRTHLSRLRAEGLAERREHCCWFAIEMDLEQLAQSLGVDGK